mgnify:CR=1 FL=1
MILKILFNGKIYLAKVDSTEYGYKFRFKEKNGQFDWMYFFVFKNLDVHWNVDLITTKNLKAEFQVKQH